MNDLLRSSLKKLRLSGLLESLEVRLLEASSHGLNHVEFLELILQDELAVRSNRQLERMVKAALFRELKPLDQFDWQFNPSLKKKQILDLAACRFILRSVMCSGWVSLEWAKAFWPRRLVIRPSRPATASCIGPCLTWFGTSCTTKPYRRRTRYYRVISSQNC